MVEGYLLINIINLDGGPKCDLVSLWSKLTLSEIWSPPPRFYLLLSRVWIVLSASVLWALCSSCGHLLTTPLTCPHDSWLHHWLIMHRNGIDRGLTSNHPYTCTISQQQWMNMCSCWQWGARGGAEQKSEMHKDMAMSTVCCGWVISGCRASDIECSLLKDMRSVGYSIGNFIIGHGFSVNVCRWCFMSISYLRINIVGH